MPPSLGGWSSEQLGGAREKRWRSRSEITATCQVVVVGTSPAGFRATWLGETVALRAQRSVSGHDCPLGPTLGLER